MTYSRDQFKNSFTKVTEVSVLPSTGATIVESSAYLNNAGKPSYVISRSLRKILKRWGPLTLPCAVPLLTAPSYGDGYQTKCVAAYRIKNCDTN